MRRGIVASAIFPLIAVVGTYAVNYHEYNVILIALLISISLYSFYLLNTDADRISVAFAIYMVSLALLIHHSLITEYIVGWDIASEYHYSARVLASGYWVPSFQNFTNSVLSIVIFSPIISLVTGLELTWVYKMVYPIIYAMAPAVLYLIFDEFLSPRWSRTEQIAGPLLFSYIFIYYNEMIGLGRQMIAEVIVAVLLLLILKPASNRRLLLLCLLMSFGVVTSHYSTGIFFTTLCVFSLLTHRVINQLSRWTPLLENLSLRHKRTTEFGVVLLLVVFITAWYAYVSGGRILLSLARLVRSIALSIPDLIARIGSAESGTTTQAATLVLQRGTPLQTLNKFFQLGAQALIGLGYIYTLVSDRLTVERNFFYVLLSFGVLSLLSASLIVPFVASSMNTTRLYHLSLIIISVYFAIGMKGVLSTAESVVTKLSVPEIHYTQVVAVFLAVFLLLNAGVLYELVGQQPGSSAIGHESTKESGSLADKIRYHSGLSNSYDYQGAVWLKNHHATDAKITTGFPALTFHSYGQFVRDDIIYPNFNADTKYTVHSFKSNALDVNIGYSYSTQRRVLVNSTGTHDDSRVYTNGNTTVYI